MADSSSQRGDAVTEVYPRICAACARLRAGATCTAYPDGIPDDIWWDGADHRSPRGDEVGGRTFVQKTTPEAREAMRLYRRHASST